MDQDDANARAFLIARQLIARHGEGVAAFLEEKIQALMEARDYEQFSAWCVIRNAVALTLDGDTSIQ